VLRILGGVEPLPLEELGLPGRDLDELRNMISRSYGLFLVCGPTGSGKTTTLHSVLRHINRPDIKIWTPRTRWRLPSQGCVRCRSIRASAGHLPRRCAPSYAPTRT
jgi:hypothetical protein